MKWRLGTRETSEAIRSGRMAEINKRLNATVEFFPVMNAADLGAGLGKASAAWT